MEVEGGSQAGRGRHVRATIKERRAAAELICLLAQCHCCANCSVDPASPFCQIGKKIVQRLSGETSLAQE